MRLIEKQENQGAISFNVTDSSGQTAKLTPLQAEDLYQWLEDHKGEIHKAIHGETAQPENDIPGYNQI